MFARATAHKQPKEHRAADRAEDRHQPRRPLAFTKQRKNSRQRDWKQRRMMHVIGGRRKGRRSKMESYRHARGGANPSAQKIMCGMRPDGAIEIGRAHV